MSTEEPDPIVTAEDTPKQPPWGEDFDAQRAWDLVQNLRGDKDTLKGQLTQAQADQQELDALRKSKMTADERAIEDAKTEAATEARTAAESQYLPKLHATQLKAAASQILTKDQLASFMEITDPKVFVNESGDVDEEKVTDHLTKMFYGVPHLQRNWGQGGQMPPPVSGYDLGKAEAERRFGTKT